MNLQVEQAAAEVKVREAAAAKREADLTRQEAATLSGNADAMKREGELAAREQALASQLADIKAAEAQLQEKKLEAKELQVSPDETSLDIDVVDVLLLFTYLLCAPKFAVTGRCHNSRGAAASEAGSQRDAGSSPARALTGKLYVVRPAWPDHVLVGMPNCRSGVAAYKHVPTGDMQVAGHARAALKAQPP